MPNDLLAARLGRPHHTAYVVDSIEATVERLAAELGAGPFVVLGDVPITDVVSLGEPATLAHDSAFGSCGGYPIELIQTKDVAPERVRARWSVSLPRVQHVGYALAPPQAEAARAAFANNGQAAYLSTRLGEGQTTYHDLSATLGHDIEIVEDAPQLREFFAMFLGAAEGWDGSEPLRRIEL